MAITADKGLRAWIWLIWKVGLWRTYRYWCHGQKQGWMTRAQADEWFQRNFNVKL